MPDPSLSVLLLGEGPLADAAARALVASGVTLTRIERPTDRDIRDGIVGVDRVVAMSRSDHVALRWALVVIHHRPATPLLVTIFDRHVAAELAGVEADVQVVSVADLVAPSFAGPCLDPSLLSLIPGPRVAGIGVEGDRPVRRPRSWRAPGVGGRAVAAVRALLRPFDASARILVYGLAGFLGVLCLDTAVMAVLEHTPVVEAFYTATKVLVTVGPNESTDRHGPALKLYSALTMLAALGFAAVATAGLVNRLLDARLTGILGRSAVPRRDHVIVVGLGQIGQRLCELLRELHIPVVVVEQNPQGRLITHARERKIPVVIGDGSDRRTLTRLSVRRARALAAVTSDDAENIAVAVAARGLRADLTIVLRAGDGDATSEIQSLFRIGVVRDLYRIAGAAVAALTVGVRAQQVFPRQGAIHVVDHAEDIALFAEPPPA